MLGLVLSRNAAKFLAIIFYFNVSKMVPSWLADPFIRTPTTFAKSS